MKLLIIGADGQVGHFLMHHARAGHEVIGTGFDEQVGLKALDITDKNATAGLIKSVQPDHVILTAALTNVDGCEEHPDKAYRINTEAPVHLAKCCREQGAGLTFFSTEYVFDGKNGPYSEADEPHPLSVYGRSKWEAEQQITAILEKPLIIRTTVVFSYLPGSVNFFMQILKRARQQEPITVPNDQIGNPTHAYNLAGAALELVEQSQTGLFNLVGTSRVGREEFAKKILEKFNFTHTQVSTLSTKELHQKAARPLQAGLKTEKASLLLVRNPLWSLDQALDFTVAQAKLKEKQDGHLSQG